MTVTMQWSGPCPFCKGTGVVKHAGCKPCNSTGTLKVDAKCVRCRWMGGRIQRSHGVHGGCMKTGLTVHGEWGCKDFEPLPNA